MCVGYVAIVHECIVLFDALRFSTALIVVIELFKSGLSKLEIRPDTTIFVEGFACLHFLTRCSILLITALGLSPHDRLLVPPINVTVSGLYVDIMSLALSSRFSALAEGCTMPMQFVSWTVRILCATPLPMELLIIIELLGFSCFL